MAPELNIKRQVPFVEAGNDGNCEQRSYDSKKSLVHGGLSAAPEVY